MIANFYGFVKIRSYLKKEKIRPSTVSRLYSFYQRNSLDTPRNLAYGMPKRLNRKLEEHPEQPIYTPKGKITVKQYVKSLDKRTIRQSKKRNIKDFTGQVQPPFQVWKSG